MALTTKAPPYVPLGASTFNVTGTGSAQTVVAAASNTRGLVLRSAIVVANNSAVAKLTWGATAGAAQQLLHMESGAAQVAAQLLPFAMFIPAGNGLFVDASATAGGSHTGSYDLL